MHFRKLTAIVFREFISQYLGRPVNEVKPEEFLWYSQQLRSTCTQRGALTYTVLCIFQILFREDPKSAHAKDLVGGWLRRGSPLVNILYDAEYKCANKKTELRQQIRCYCLFVVFFRVHLSHPNRLSYRLFVVFCSPCSVVWFPIDPRLF